MVTAEEFVKENGLWVFRYALAQLSFKTNMYLVVYSEECDFVNEIKPHHGNCVFSYSDVDRMVRKLESCNENPN